MNPFFFPPRSIQSVDPAKYVISLFRNEIASAVSSKALSDERLTATLNVLQERHPELAADLQLLVDLATTSGHLEGSRQSLDTILSQFRAELPYSVRVALGLVPNVKPAQ